MPMKRNKKGYVGGGKMKKKGMSTHGRTTMKKQMMRGGGAMKKKGYAMGGATMKKKNDEGGGATMSLAKAKSRLKMNS